jgi:soluble lytic murein transglycosylase
MALACLSLATLALPGATGPARSEMGAPLPFAAPERPATPAPFDGMATGATLHPSSPLELTDEGDLAPLKDGIDALAGGDIPAARAARDRLPAEALDRHIIEWAIALGGSPAVSSDEIAAAMRDLSSWPGMATLKANREKALLREEPAPEKVIAALAGTKIESIEGAIILARSHVALGNIEAARQALAPFWRTEKLEARQEIALLKEFGGIIAAGDHRFRMERMMYADRVKSGERLAGRVGAEALVKAWSAVIRGDRNAGALLDAVPKEQRSAGYLMAQVQYLRRGGKIAEAAAIMRAAPRDAETLVDPDAWWIERRVLSRELLDLGDAKAAYEVAAGHAAESPALAVDAEFHAGWYALRALRDADAAAKHFARIAEIADGPISLSRAFYWQGRAAQEGGSGNAGAFYARAARYGTTFYGQLAAARLGRMEIEIDMPQPTPADRQAFGKREAVRAIRRLEAAGDSRRADMLYRALGRELASPGELSLLTAMADSRDDHFLALRVAKAAASRGLAVGGLAHPVGAIPDEARIDGAGKALAYAIARQESEFNVGAVSRAGARGLLQLLPGTARDMAKQAGLDYSLPRLTSDAGYNATLGAAYLSEQLGRFDGSYVLTFAGYNAGPRRAREWIERYGDPRGKDIDAVVDWVERIPFTETRNYVQRVMENYQVYKMRLVGNADIAADLTHGRR